MITKAVTAASYSPAHSENDTPPIIVDKTTGRQLITALIDQTGSGAHTITSTAPTSSAASPLVAGAKSISFIASTDFVGTINGTSFLAGASKSYTASLGKTLPAIAYTVTAGTLYIDVIT